MNFIIRQNEISENIMKHNESGKRKGAGICWCRINMHILFWQVNDRAKLYERIWPTCSADELMMKLIRFAAGRSSFLKTEAWVQLLQRCRTWVYKESCGAHICWTERRWFVGRGGTRVLCKTRYKTFLPSASLHGLSSTRKGCHMDRSCRYRETTRNIFLIFMIEELRKSRFSIKYKTTK